MNDDPAHYVPSPAPTIRTPERSTAPRRVASRDLFGGGRELVIVHDGRHYYLRITQNGKLILTA
jgi:hemin uptake protein HemP